MKVASCVCGVVMLGLVIPLGAGATIAMKASPHISFAPATLTIRMTVEAEADNRSLEVALESDEFYRSSTIQLDGDQAPRTSILEFRAVPQGKYFVSATVYGQNGQSRATTRQMINVIGEESER